MDVKKPIRVDYYEIWSYEQKDKNTFKENKCDISAILESMTEVPITERTFEYGGEKIRFQIIKYDEVNKIWEIQVLRGRSIMPLGIVDEEKGNYTYFQLGEHKYYAESISILYSVLKNTLALQINHTFVTRSVLEDIFNKLKNDSSYSIQLRPIIVKGKRERIAEAEYCTKLAFITKKPEKEVAVKETLLGDLYGVMNKFNGAQLRLEIGFGRNLKKKDTLNLEQVRGLINVIDEVDGIEDVLIDYKTKEDDLVDSLSLIKEKVEDWIIVVKEKGKPIEHVDVLSKMKKKFVDRIQTNML